MKDLDVLIEIRDYLEIITLRDLTWGKDVLEIGSYKGATAVIMAKHAKHVFCIDTFTSDNIPNTITDIQGTDTLPEFLERTKDYINIDYLIGNSLSAHKLIPDDWFDVLFHDGAHDFKTVYMDLVHYYPKIKKKGVFIIHDWGVQWSGVIGACVYFFERFPDQIVNNLAVYLKK